MSYELRALIASKRILESVAGKLPGALPVELAQGLWLLPLKGNVSIEAVSKPPPFEKLQVPPFLAQAASEASAAGPIAYVEADYRPGRDYQAAVLWDNGRVVLGPHEETTPWDPREANMKERPVNSVLHAMDVEALDYGDEWDAVALARHGRTEDW
ncbi:MAG: hypothetical protein NTX64_07630 [Elusimicrobia bacterium]|nr:hypothetical protein [Elusimicrobiota bacterium]